MLHCGADGWRAALAVPGVVHARRGRRPLVAAGGPRSAPRQAPLRRADGVARRHPDQHPGRAAAAAEGQGHHPRPALQRRAAADGVLPHGQRARTCGRCCGRWSIGACAMPAAGCRPALSPRRRESCRRCRMLESPAARAPGRSPTSDYSPEGRLTLLLASHVVVSLVAIAAGVVMAAGLLGTPPRHRASLLFLWTTIVTSLSGFRPPGRSDPAVARRRRDLAGAARRRGAWPGTAIGSPVAGAASGSSPPWRRST